MNVTKKIIIAFCSGFFLSLTSNAQTTLNLYPINGVIGLKFLTEKKISFEPRIDFQVDVANGENNIFINTELFSTVNFLKDDNLNFYTGIGLGANIYNQAESNFSGSLPLGATYYLNEKRRIAIIGECGIKVTASEYLKLKSYALVGLQIRLKK